MLRFDLDHRLSESPIPNDLCVQVAETKDDTEKLLHPKQSDKRPLAVVLEGGVVIAAGFLNVLSHTLVLAFVVASPQEQHVDG